MKVRPRNTYGLSVRTLATLITIRERHLNEEMKVLHAQLVAAMGEKPEENPIPAIPSVTVPMSPAQAQRVAKRLKRNDHHRPLAMTVGDVRQMVREEFAKRQEAGATGSCKVDRTQRAFDRRYQANAMRVICKQFGLQERKRSYASNYQAYWQWISTAMTLARRNKCTVWKFLERPDALQLILQEQCTRKVFTRRVQQRFDGMLKQLKRASSLIGDIISQSVPPGVSQRELRQMKREIRQHMESELSEKFKPVLAKRDAIIGQVVTLMYGAAA